MSHEGHKGFSHEGHADHEGSWVFFFVTFVSFVASFFVLFAAERGGGTV